MTGETARTLEGYVNIADQDDRKSKLMGMLFEQWKDGYETHAPVGSYKPNGFGLHDMAGNLGEWCRDRYGSYESPVRPRDGLRATWKDRAHVMRGGCFLWHSWLARCAWRFYVTPDGRADAFGIRPAACIRGLKP
jgi:formylglycine-generating enzyme required for sulfatase activity